MASTSTSRSAPGTNKRDTSTVVTVGGVPVKRAARTLPYSGSWLMSVRKVRMLTTSARVAPWAAKIAVMLSMMYSAWAPMSLPPTILPSASMAAWPDSCSMVLSPSSARATWEYWPAGAGTVAGLSKLTMMAASVGIRGGLVASRAVLREELLPSWVEPGRPRYAPDDCTWRIPAVGQYP